MSAWIGADPDPSYSRLDRMDGLGRMNQSDASRILEAGRVPDKRSTYEEPATPVLDPRDAAIIRRNVSVLSILTIFTSAGFWLGFLTRGAL